MLFTLVNHLPSTLSNPHYSRIELLFPYQIYSSSIFPVHSIQIHTKTNIGWKQRTNAYGIRPLPSINQICISAIIIHREVMTHTHTQTPSNHQYNIFFIKTVSIYFKINDCPSHHHHGIYSIYHQLLIKKIDSHYFKITVWVIKISISIILSA